MMVDGSLTQSRLADYAAVLVHVGLRVVEGDRLLIRSGKHASPLVHEVARESYRAGALNVDVLWNEPEIDEARLIDGSPAAMENLPYGPEVMNRAAGRGDSVLTLLGDELALSSKVDGDRLAEFTQRVRSGSGELFEKMMKLEIAWTVAAVPSVGWARLVFPDRPAEAALDALWNAVLMACRIDGDNPLADWEAHLDHLDARKAYLNQQAYTAVRYHGPGTDLTVGLNPAHFWNHPGEGNGQRRTVANIPTEEVSTSPDSRIADGIVQVTKPLVHSGRIIEGIQLRFKDGKVVNATADEGHEHLDRILSADGGAGRLGEVALVPQSSAIASQNLVWHQTLYDENDASHLALGAGYPFGIRDGIQMTPVQLGHVGLNQSINHIDLVVGSTDVTISGVTASDGLKPLIRDGEWAFTL
jgi:aminopeptidase